MVCTGHNGVTDARDYKYSNVVFHTVFQNNIPIMAVDAAQKHRVDTVQHGKILDALPCRSCGDHFILGIKTVFTNQLLHTTSGIINNSCGLWREGFKVGVVSVISPNRGHNNLPRKGCHARKNIRQVLGQKPNHDIHDKIADRSRQKLLVDDFGDTLHRHQKSVINASKDDEQHKEQCHNQIVALCVVRRCNALSIV